MTAHGRLVIDGGQTGTRLRTQTSDGVVGEPIEAGPIHTDRPVVAQIAEYARAVLTSASTAASSITQVAAGVSGLTPQWSRPGDLLTALSDLGVDSVALAHDSVSAYLAANHAAFGATIAVGTGVVSLGVGDAGTARVDGWGYLFGDAGSAFWIGRAGLDAALRAFDGRGPATTLRDRATEVFGPLPELYMTLQGNADRVALTAGFARIVDECAVAGDRVAAGINDAAADQLALSVSTALQRSGWTSGAPGRVSWMGTVLARNERIRDRFVTLVTASAPGVRVEPPLGTALDGVSLLLDLPADHPLAADIHRATTVDSPTR